MMQTLTTLFIASFLARALAGKFSLPITKTERTVPKHSPSFQNQQDGFQKLLLQDRYFTHSSQAGIPTAKLSSRDSAIQAQNFWVYTTNISVGTPPQNFRTIVDLNWSDLFLPSAFCRSVDPLYCSTVFSTYNYSSSSTYQPNGTFTTISYGLVNGYARLSEDVLTLADGLKIPSLAFHEMVDYHYMAPESDSGLFDGVLGLAIDKPWVPGYPRTPMTLPSPFRSMIDHHLLDQNMFSIVWPNEEREHGSLVFGGYDEDLLDGDLVSHPLFPADETHWQVQLQSISMVGESECGGKKTLIDKSLTDTKAFFKSISPTISLPYSIAQSIIHRVTSWPSGCVYAAVAVDCDDVSSLPEIIIGFKGQNVTLRGEDYVQKRKPPKCGYADGECLLLIDSVPWAYGDDVVFLGMPFLQKVMGVWNWDEKTVSFGKLKA